MIYHITRMTMRPGVPADKVEEGLEAMRNHGRVIPSVISFIVGPDIGGEYEWASAYTIADLEGYWEYLKHPAHRHTDEIGLPLVDKFVSFDITDDPDPQIAEKIAALWQRRFDEDPALAQLVANLNSYTGSSAPGPDAG